MCDHETQTRRLRSQETQREASVVIPMVLCRLTAAVEASRGSHGQQPRLAISPSRKCPQGHQQKRRHTTRRKTSHFLLSQQCPWFKRLCARAHCFLNPPLHVFPEVGIAALCRHAQPTVCLALRMLGNVPRPSSTRGGQGGRSRGTPRHECTNVGLLPRTLRFAICMRVR